MAQNETLTSLAMLKVNADVLGRDYIDYLTPFIGYLINKHNPDPITREKIREMMQNEFGLNISSGICEMALRRLAKRYLKLDNKVFHVKKRIPAPPIEQKRMDAQKRIAGVISSLMKFAESGFQVCLTTQECHDALVAYLSSFSIECLKAYSQGTALPQVASGKGNAFIINSFVQWAKETDPDLFDSIIVIVKGHMLANALICPDLESIQNKFDKVVFYLDTPLVLDLIGLHGIARKDAATELLDLLHRLNATVALFEHTSEEIHRVIKHCEDHIDDPKVRSTAMEEIRRSNKSASDLALLRADLDQIYDSARIRLNATPPYIAPFQIDEKVLQVALADEIKYMNPRAIHYDINSIRSIYVLRKGKEPTRLERASAVLVTTNASLARAAYEYGRDKESTREISSVIADFSLANIAWLKAPLASPDLPRMEIIALCHAAMEPRETLWKKYIDEIDKLKSQGNISPDMHAVLRSSAQARKELMHLTLGSEESFSSQTVEEVIQRLKTDMTKEKDEEIRKERVISSAARLEAETFAKRNIKQRKHLYGIIDRTETVVKWSVFGVLCVFLTVFAIFSTIVTNEFSSAAFWFIVLVNALVWSGIVFGVLNLLFGISALSVSGAIAEKVKARLIMWLIRD